MPSLHGLLGRKPNPYLNAHHSSHRATTKDSTIDHTASNAQAQNASSLLAQARELAGRDPVTGRLRSDAQSSRTSERWSSAQSTTLAGPRHIEQEERTCYQSRAAHSKQTTGHKYDLFVQESLAKRDAENRVRAARGGHEYYAPERRLEEYYSRGVQD
ncbi:hypothetical protein ACN47E_009178 [Coniothyrium glycines]